MQLLLLNVCSLLFSLVMDVLAVQVTNSDIDGKLVCSVNITEQFVILLADSVSLIAETFAGLRVQLDIYATFTLGLRLIWIFAHKGHTDMKWCLHTRFQCC